MTAFGAGALGCLFTRYWHVPVMYLDAYAETTDPVILHQQVVMVLRRSNLASRSEASVGGPRLALVSVFSNSRANVRTSVRYLKLRLWKPARLSTERVDS